MFVRFYFKTNKKNIPKQLVFILSRGGHNSYCILLLGEESNKKQEKEGHILTFGDLPSLKEGHPKLKIKSLV